MQLILQNDARRFFQKSRNRSEITLNRVFQKGDKYFVYLKHPARKKTVNFSLGEAAEVTDALKALNSVYLDETKWLKPHASKVPSRIYAQWMGPDSLLKLHGNGTVQRCKNTIPASPEKRRHLSPYAGNPFSEMGLARIPIENQRTKALLKAEQELEFLSACDAWQLPIFLPDFDDILRVHPRRLPATSRRALGTAVFGGMIASTVLAIFFVPSFYVVWQWFGERVFKEKLLVPHDVEHIV